MPERYVTVAGEDCSELETWRPEITALAAQVENYAAFMLTNPRNVNLNRKLTQLIGVVNQTKGVSELPYLRAVAEIATSIEGDPSIPTEVVQRYNLQWESFSTLAVKCGIKLEPDNPIETATKGPPDEPVPGKPKEKCVNNPGKWGVRFIYKEYQDCQGDAPNTSVVGSTNQEGGEADLFDTFKGLLDKDPLVTDNQLQTRGGRDPVSRPRPTTNIDRAFVPRTDNQLQTTLPNQPTFRVFPPTNDTQMETTKGRPMDISGAILEAVTDTSDVRDALIGATDVPVREWYLTLLPAIQSILPKQGTRDVPNSMPGVQFRAANRIVKHHVPGMNPIYQNLGVDSLYITFVGTFTGDGGLSTALPQNLFDSFSRPMAPPEVATLANQEAASSQKTSALTRYSLYGSDANLFQQDGCPGQCPPPGTRGPYPIDTNFIDAEWQDVETPEGKKTLGDISGELDAYKEFTSFYKMAYSEGRHLEIEINMRRNRDGLVVKGNPLDPNYADPLREGGGNPRFKGYVRRLESYLQSSDRVWYLIEVEVTDHGDVTNMPLNLTNTIAQEEPAPTQGQSKLAGDQEKVAQCLIGRGLLQGGNSKLNMGKGKTLYIFANGQGAVVNGDLKVENVEAILEPQEALTKGIAYVLAGEEVNLYRNFIPSVNITPTTPPPNHLLSSSTLTLEGYAKGGWTNYESFQTDGAFNYLYLHQSGYGFIGPSPDKIQGALSSHPNIKIHSPNFVMESIIPNLPDDSKWKAMRTYIQNSTITSKDPCDPAQAPNPSMNPSSNLPPSTGIISTDQVKLMVDDPLLGVGFRGLR